MKIYLSKIFFIFFILSVIPAFASVYGKKADINTLAGKLPEIKDTECTFKQEKILKNVQKPLISGGNFKFTKKEGAVFETTYPNKTTASYDEINKILFRLANKDYARLNKHFDFYFEKTNNFKLLLVPKADSKESSFIKSVQIEGDLKIDKITIDTKNGDRIIQWFYQK